MSPCDSGGQDAKVCINFLILLFFCRPNLTELIHHSHLLLFLTCRCIGTLLNILLRPLWSHDGRLKQLVQKLLPALNGDGHSRRLSLDPPPLD